MICATTVRFTTTSRCGRDYELVVQFSDRVSLEHAADMMLRALRKIDLAAGKQRVESE